MTWELDCILEVKNTVFKDMYENWFHECSECCTLIPVEEQYCEKHSQGECNAYWFRKKRGYWEINSTLGKRHTEPTFRRGINNRGGGNFEMAKQQRRSTVLLTQLRALQEIFRRECRRMPRLPIFSTIRFSMLPNGRSMEEFPRWTTYWHDSRDDQKAQELVMLLVLFFIIVFFTKGDCLCLSIFLITPP